MVVPIGALFALLVLAATMALVLGMRAREVRDAQRNLRGLDLLLGEETARTLQGVDLVISGIAADLKAHGNDTAERFLTQQEDRATHLALAAKLEGLPQLDALALVAADGRMLNSSRGWPVPRSSIVESDAFAALLTSPQSQGLMLGQPVDDRGMGTRILPLARRVTGQDGQLAGLVVGTLRLDYFRNLYAGIQPEPLIEINLWTSDGSLLLRAADMWPQGAPEHLPAFGMARLKSGEPVEYFSPGNALQPERLVAAMRSAAYPVIIGVTQVKSVALAEWTHDALAVGVAGLGCTGLILLLTWMLTRSFAAYEETAEAVLAREEAVRGREAAEGQLRQALKMEAIGQLTAGLAHDFNNLLTSIIGNLDLLEQRGPAQRPIEIIRQASDRAASLTRQLLAFSRQQLLQPMPVSLRELLDGMQDLLRSSVGGTITLERRMPDGLWPIFADAVQIENLILNLAINARDAMPLGGLLVLEAANVRRGSKELPPETKPGDFVRITLRDTGQGMPPGVLARAFDPFFTTKPAGKGTGLGLSQVYGFARQSGGGVTIASEPGQGTTVSVFLPRAEGMVEEKDVAPPVVASAKAPLNAAVMLVDDDPLVRETLARALMAMGCTPLTEPDADSALRRLERGAHVDAVLLDFAMPGMSGPELAAKLRLTRPALPIVFMTGYGDPSTLQDEKMVLRKPFRSAELAQMLRQMLDPDHR